MRQEAKRLSRRDLFKVGTAIAGAALLEPSVVRLAISSEHRQDLAARQTLETPVAFPQHLRPSKLKRPNIVLIVMDTVRADHLSCYGYHRETTPNIDAFAARSRMYKNVLSPSCWTLPSHASLFTGLSCSAHGTKILHRGLDGRFTTLAQHLAANGYQTVGLASNAILSTTLGFDRGFQTYWTFPADKDAFSDVSNSDSIATVMHAQLAKWLTEKYDANEPFFLFLNYVEAHQPYRPPRDMLKYASTESWDRWQGRNQPVLSFDYMLTGTDLLSSKDIAELESLYDDEIRQLDRKVGELLEYFKSTGLDENTLVIITADHGEHFGERHRMSHQFSLYEPLVRVPLVVRYADRFQGGEEERLVQSHDIFPTVLQLAGLEWKPKPGQTCQSLLEPASEKRTGISEYLMFDAGALERVSVSHPQVDLSPFARRLRAIQRGNLKLIQPAPGKPELYDLTSDPTETRDLADQQPDVTRDLSDKLAAWSRSFEHYAASPVPRDLKESAPSEAEIKAMRGLGYLQ